MFKSTDPDHPDDLLAVAMVILKDDSYSREPRPQIVRSKSVGAITRRSHGPMDLRKHKKKPYSSTGSLRKRRNSSCPHASSPVPNAKIFPRNQMFSYENCVLTNFNSDAGSVFKTSSNFERRISMENIVKGSNLSEEIPDYSSNSLISWSAKNPCDPSCEATRTLTDTSVHIFDGQLPGQFRHQCPQFVNNEQTNVYLQETIPTIQTNSSSAEMESDGKECLTSDENSITVCQPKLEDAPSMITHQYSHHLETRAARRPLTTCSLHDNQFNVQRSNRKSPTPDSVHDGQSKACQHKQYIPRQMTNDENVTNEMEFTCFVSTEDDGNKHYADQGIHSPRFKDECLACEQHNRNKTKILTHGDMVKLTDEMNVLGSRDDPIPQSSYYLRRQDTVLLQPDKIDDDNDNDAGDFDSFFESLKMFLCQEVPDDQDDDDHHEVNTTEDEARVSYKNLLNCRPRYLCSLCDSNLELLPFQQHDGDWENEFFPVFILENSTSPQDMYCPQCCCLRSVYCQQ